MPIDPSVAIGAQLPDRTFSWTSSDVLLYHLGIGAGSRPGDNLNPAALRYTLDNDDLQVLPSFAVVIPTFFEVDAPRLDLPGCDIDLQKVLHGSQEVITYHRQGVIDNSQNYWKEISDPELSANWNLACRGQITFTGFAPTVIRDAGPRNQDALVPGVKEACHKHPAQ